MDRLEKLGIVVIMLAFFLVSLILFLPPNQSKQITILRDSLDNETKDKLYYRTQYLKANGQLIELKNRIISNEIIIN